MGSTGRDDGAQKPPGPTVPDAKPDRRAEALRANLKRRKAQARARDEARHDAPRPEASGQDG